MRRRKICPRCAEKVRAPAQVCRYCGYAFADPAPAGPVADVEGATGHLGRPSATSISAPTALDAPRGEFSEGVAPDASPSSTATGTPDTDAGRRTWVEVVRWFLVIAYPLATWPVVTDPDTWADSQLAGRIGAGVIISVLWLASLSVVWWGVLRLVRKRRRSYLQVLVSIPVLLTAFFLANLSVVGREASDRESSERSLAASADAALPGTATPEQKLARRRTAFAEWYDDSVSVLAATGKTLAPVRKVVGSRDPSDAELQTWFDQAHASAQTLTARVTQLRSNDPELGAVTRQMRRAAHLMLAATRDYSLGLAADDLDRVERGDPKIRRGQRLMVQASNRADRLYTQLGGYDAFRGKIDFDRAAELAGG